MQINPGDGSGVVDEIDDICGSDSVSFPLVSKIRRVNLAIDKFNAIALAFDKSFTWDDKNKYEADGSTLRKLPIARTALKTGQQDYPFADELCYLKSVFVKDKQGIYHELEEELAPDQKNTLLLPPNHAGVPTKFRLVGNSILLDFIPDYDMDGGLKVEFSRNGSKFRITDTNKELGVPSLFVNYICRYASLPFLIQNRMGNKNDIAALIAQDEDPKNPFSIPSFMANRNRTRHGGMRSAPQNNK